VPYFRPPVDLIETWRQKLGVADGMKVGLAWSGSPTNTRNRWRSCPFDQLAPLLDIAGVTCFNLQTGDAAAEMRALSAVARMVDRTADLTDWADTAALIANLDLVIS